MMVNFRVLYFDDEPIISSSIVESLQLMSGWQVNLTSEIDDLFRELQYNQYDAIIMDIMAPIPPLENKYVTFTQDEINKMRGGFNTGVVLTKKIVSLSMYKNLPILFLSARKNPIPENSELQDYRCNYLRKPVLVSTVYEALQQLLNESRN